MSELLVRFFFRERIEHQHVPHAGALRPRADRLIMSFYAGTAEVKCMTRHPSRTRQRRLDADQGKTAAARAAVRRPRTRRGRVRAGATAPDHAPTDTDRSDCGVKLVRASRPP